MLYTRKVQVFIKFVEGGGGVKINIILVLLLTEKIDQGERGGGYFLFCCYIVNVL